MTASTIVFSEREPNALTAGELRHRAYWLGIAATFSHELFSDRALEEGWVDPARPAGMTDTEFTTTVDEGFEAGVEWARKVLAEAAEPQPMTCINPDGKEWTPNAAEAEAYRAAEALEPLLGREPDICSDADDDNDVAVMLYPGEIAKLLRLAGGAR